MTDETFMRLVEKYGDLREKAAGWEQAASDAGSQTREAQCVDESRRLRLKAAGVARRLLKIARAGR